MDDYIWLNVGNGISASHFLDVGGYHIKYNGGCRRFGLRERVYSLYVCCHMRNQLPWGRRENKNFRKPESETRYHQGTVREKRVTKRKSNFRFESKSFFFLCQSRRTKSMASKWERQQHPLTKMNQNVSLRSTSFKKISFVFLEGNAAHTARCLFIDNVCGIN